MEKIIWTIVSMLLILPQVAVAQCNTIAMRDSFASVEQHLLEGAVQQAQGTLFNIKESIHCHTFSSREYQDFSFYTAIYYHLLSNPQQAEHYFINSNPNKHPLFGETIQKYAQVFTQTKPRIPLHIVHSRFQQLLIDGKESKANTKITKGTHLLQLIHKKTQKPLHAQWYTIDERQRNNVRLPRFTPKWPLFIAGTQSFIAGYSFWMAYQKGNEAQQTNSIEEYHNTNRQRNRWLISGGGFSILGLAFFGVYYKW